MAHTERDVLLNKLEEANKKVKVNAKYRHTKTGGEYLVLALVIREDNEEVRVIYKDLSHEPPITWDRSLDGEDGWTVPTEIDGKLVPRFTQIS